MAIMPAPALGCRRRQLSEQRHVPTDAHELLSVGGASLGAEEVAQRGEAHLLGLSVRREEKLAELSEGARRAERAGGGGDERRVGDGGRAHFCTCGRWEATRAASGAIAPISGRSDR